MKEAIMKVPSFSADYPKAPIYVADLVRCKECRYKNDCEQSVLMQSFCNEIEEIRDIEFCSYGERKDNE